MGLNSTHEDRFVLSVLNAIMGGGMSSRLFQEIREKRGLAYAVFSYHANYLDTGSVHRLRGDQPGQHRKGDPAHPGGGRAHHTIDGEHG